MTEINTELTSGEPDEHVWKEGTSGLFCVVIRDPDFYTYAGYVVIPKNDHTDGIDASTFADFETSPPRSITYVGPPLVDHDDLDSNSLWVGFDCLSPYDALPNTRFEPLFKSALPNADDDVTMRTYKTFEYVETVAEEFAGYVSKQLKL